jgi:hypothetical protein
LTVSTDALDAARAHIKKEKFRIVTLEAPNPAKLSAAVTVGLWDCIKLYTENPPKGSKDNFGLAGYNAWAQALTKSTGKKSWSKLLATDMDFFGALTTAYNFSQLFGKDSSHTAERNLFADFLEEAAIILNKPALNEIAPQFRKAGEAWCEVGQALLPDDVAPFKQYRDLIDRRHALFLSQGNAAHDELLSIKAHLKQVKQAITDNFPLDEQGKEHLKANLAEKVLAVHNIEKEGIMALRDALS